MGPRILAERFEAGKNLTRHELREVYKTINGKHLPVGANPRDVATFLMKYHALRFEFEVNRLRGYAWNNGEEMEHENVDERPHQNL